MLQYFERRLPVVFNILFVMTEGQDIQYLPEVWHRMVVMNFLDYFQILNAVIHPEFGWNDRTVNVMQKFDLLHWVTYLVSTVVPRYVFLALAFVFIAVGVLNAAYAVRLFDSGNVQKAWPIAVLRWTCHSIFGTFFVTVMRWLLIPVDCVVRDDYNLSDEIHGAGHGCTPFDLPEMIPSIVAILTILVGTAFAWWATLVNFRCNILSRTAYSQCTGRVEIWFLLSKAGIVFLPYVCQYISATAVTVILFLICFLTFYRHLHILPYHHRPSNLLRGGMYASIMWSTIAGILVTVIDNETLHWVFLTMIPISFLGGVAFTHLSYSHSLKELDRIRGEWEEKQHAANGSAASDEGGMSKLKAAVCAGQGPQKPKSAKEKTFEYFFDPSFERKRAFHSGQHALTCLRVLLYQQQKEDIPFMHALITRAQQEFPRFVELKFFRLCLNAFVFDLPSEVAIEQKRFKANQETLPLDLRFILYSVERHGGSSSEGLGIGKDGQISAMNLMEYKMGLKRAKAAHLASVHSMKSYWNKAASSDAKNQIGDMIRHLEDFSRSSKEASKEYKNLLYKYPTSVELLYCWSTFADSILNDAKEADDAREKAKGYQEDEAEIPAEATLQVDLEHQEARTADSGGTSSSDNRRMGMNRQFWGFRNAIMLSEEVSLIALTRRIQFTIFIIIAVATTGFVISDFILFKSMAKKEMKMITTVGDMRTSAVSIAFHIREVVNAAWFYGEERFQHDQKNGRKLALHIAEENYYIRDHLAFAEAYHYFNDKIFHAMIPQAGHWELRNMTLWELGNDFARRADLACTATFDEMQSHSFALANISDAKRGVPYVFENFFRTVTPAYEGLEELYVHEMEVIKSITDLLVSVISALNGVLLLAMTIITLLGMTRLVTYADHKRVFSLMALSLPRPTVKKLTNFYREHEKRLRMLEDEDIEKQETMMEEVAHAQEEDLDGTNHGTEKQEPQGSIGVNGIASGQSDLLHEGKQMSRSGEMVEGSRLSAKPVFSDTENSAEEGVTHVEKDHNPTDSSKPHASALLNSIFNSSFRPWDRQAGDESGERTSKRRGSSNLGELPTRDARDDPVLLGALDLSMKMRKVWFNRVEVYIVIMCLLMLLGLMSTAYPPRNMPALITLAPIVDNAGRREELARGLIVYARELVMADGLSRHTQQELSNAMQWLIDEFKAVDKAIRLGHDKGIDVGADERNEQHNSVMYTGVCPWREDPSNCDIAEKPSASGKGLLFLSNTFVDAAESVLARYGVPIRGDLETFEHLRAADDWDHPEFIDVYVEHEAYQNFTHDTDLRFMIQSFDGDLFLGFKHIEILFDHEMEDILEQGIQENELLFSLYVVMLIIGFYFLVFRRAIRRALSEVTKCRDMVMQVPAFTLSTHEGTIIQEHFVPASEPQHDDDM